MLTSIVGHRSEPHNAAAVRAVHSSGGAAGGVVSEGQGYGLLLAGTLALGVGRSHPRRAELLTLALELFNGWHRMCLRTVANSCQEAPYMCGEPGAPHECLPSWKFDHTLEVEIGTGSAPDGDEDAILGMVFLVLATQHDQPRPRWWAEVARWAYQSCNAFLHLLTADHPRLKASNGLPLRALKLGSCWGGWDCNNPSYHGPGHFAAFRDYMLAFSSRFGAEPSEGRQLVPRWESLIETSYAIVGSSQCPSTGLVPNWYIPVQSSGAGAGTTGCSGSGTPAAEYGSEAARTSWRFALHWILYGDRRAAAFAEPVAAHLPAQRDPTGARV